MSLTLFVVFGIILYLYYCYKIFVKEEEELKEKRLKEKEEIEIENRIYSKSKLYVIPDGYDVD